MKECKDCELCNGFDYSDGTPHCSYDEGYEACPYNDIADTKESGVKLEIDTDWMQAYITHTVENSIQSKSEKYVKEAVAEIVNGEIKSTIEKITTAKINEVLDKSIEAYMSSDITIGGGWSTPARTLTHEEYLGEIIKEELDERFGDAKLSDNIRSEIVRQIDRFTNNVKKDINAKTSELFTTMMRKTLTDNVVNLLMDTETYQKLSNSMSALLPTN